MKFVSFNVRTEAAADGINRFHFRKGFIMDRLEAESPDIIGFQELTPPMFDYMNERLRRLGYLTLGCGRDADYGGEHNPVAFKMDKYEPLALDVSWLSDTPHIPGSRYEQQSSCPRIITHLVLRPVDSAQPFHVYNTHLDHQYAQARVKGARRVIEKLRADSEINPFPLLLSGDFNAHPDDEEMALILRDPFGLMHLTEGIGVSYHGWGSCREPQIDYIFARGFELCRPARKWTDELNGIYLSDHYPVEAEVRLLKSREIK